MTEKTPRERVTEKLNTSSLASDIKNAKIKSRIENIEMTDGKLTANFCISGLPTSKEKDYSDSYRNIPKIFDNWEGLSKYADVFLKASDEELIKIAKES